MSNRLNKANREAILRDVMRYRWTVPVTDLYKRRADAAAVIFDFIYPLATRSHLDRLPVGFVPDVTRFKVQIGGQVTTLTFSGGPTPYNNRFHEIDTPAHVRRRVKYSDFTYYNDGSTGVLGVIDAGHSLASLWERIDQDTETLAAEYRNAEVILSKNLKAATTFPRLIEQWPEIETFAKPYFDKEQNRSLPVVQRDTLNELFYLPPPTTEETDDDQTSAK